MHSSKLIADKPVFDEIINGDIREAKSGYILQGVNAQGKIGAGLAKSIIKTWPDVKHHYMQNYKNGGDFLFLGSHHFVFCTDEVNLRKEELWVVNMVTQEYYGRDGFLYFSYAAFETALVNTIRIINKNAKSSFIDTPKTIHFPKIGCGLAGGDWEVVKEIITRIVPDDFRKVFWDHA